MKSILSHFRQLKICNILLILILFVTSMSNVSARDLQSSSDEVFDLSDNQQIVKYAMKLTSRTDGLNISVMVIMPKEDPKAVVQLSHGVCGCKERFLPFMEYMARHGVVCVAGDHRGHGASIKSDDDLGYMYEGGYMALVDDMRMITDWIHGKFPKLPVYLVGHSMGSMAARVYVKYDDSQIDGLIVCGSPSWNPMSRVGKFLSGMMCTFGLGRSRMSMAQRMTSNRYNKRFASEGVQAWTCSDPEVRRQFAQTPTCNFTLTANGSYNVMCLMRETYKKDKWMVSNPELPIRFISGADDPMMLSDKKFMDAVKDLCNRGYKNVTSATFPQMRHEILNEIGKEAVWDDILNFMGIND